MNPENPYEYVIDTDGLIFMVHWFRGASHFSRGFTNWIEVQEFIKRHGENEDKETQKYLKNYFQGK